MPKVSRAEIADAITLRKLEALSQRRIITTPTGEGVPCDCPSGTRVDPRTGKMLFVHHHGEFHHLLPRFRKGVFDTSIKRYRRKIADPNA